MPNVFSRAGSAVVLTALAALALSGCSHDETPPSTTVVAPAPGATPVAATTPGTPGTPGAPGNPATKVNVNAGPGASTGTDTATADAVNKAIVTNKQMTGSRIEAVVTDGVCTLTGITQDKAQKGIAEQTARRVAGVTEVKNKIEIRPTGGAGKTSLAKPVTKVIVVHEKTPAAPAPPQPPAPPMPPAPASSGSTMSGGTMKGHQTTKGKSDSDSDTTGTSDNASGSDNSSGTTTTDTTTTTPKTGNGQ